MIRSVVAACGAACLASAAWSSGAWAQTTTAPEQLQRWQGTCRGDRRSARGARLFVAKGANALNCAACHGQPPTGAARHASTGKRIEPLAPAFNAERFTDQAKVDKWFRRNCKDVFARECGAGEKADLLAYLLSLSR